MYISSTIRNTTSTRFSNCKNKPYQIRLRIAHVMSKQKAQKVAKKTRPFLTSLQPFALFAYLYCANESAACLRERYCAGLACSDLARVSQNRKTRPEIRMAAFFVAERLSDRRLPGSGLRLLAP